MKTLICIAFAFLSIQVAMCQDDYAALSWGSSEHDFGQIEQGVPVTHEFTFVNTGKEMLIITNVKTSCGCTSPAWTKDPVPPGGEGYVKVTFNAASLGIFHKSVTLNANVKNGMEMLHIKGEVLSESEYKKSSRSSSLK